MLMLLHTLLETVDRRWLLTIQQKFIDSINVDAQVRLSAEHDGCVVIDVNGYKFKLKPFVNDTNGQFSDTWVNLLVKDETELTSIFIEGLIKLINNGFSDAGYKTLLCKSKPVS